MCVCMCYVMYVFMYVCNVLMYVCVCMYVLRNVFMYMCVYVLCNVCMYLCVYVMYYVIYVCDYIKRSLECPTPAKFQMAGGVFFLGGGAKFSISYLMKSNF